jgi:hypothetical protein
MATGQNSQSSDQENRRRDLSKASLAAFSAEIKATDSSLANLLDTIAVGSGELGDSFEDISRLAKETARSLRDIGTRYYDVIDYSVKISEIQTEINSKTVELTGLQSDLAKLDSETKKLAQEKTANADKLVKLQEKMVSAGSLEKVAILEDIKNNKKLNDSILERIQLNQQNVDIAENSLTNTTLEQKRLISAKNLLEQLQTIQKHYNEINDKALAANFNIDQAASSISRTLESTISTFDKFPLLSNVLGVNNLKTTLSGAIKSSLLNSLNTGKLSTKSLFSAAIEGAGALMKSISPLQIALLAASGIITLIVAAFKEADANVTELSKNLDVSKETAMAVAKNADSIANKLGLAGITGKEVQAAMVDLREEFGLLQMATGATQEQFVKSFSILKNRVGLSSEEILNLNNTATLLGTNLNDLTGKAYAFGDGLIGGKATLKEISKLSKTLIVSFKGTSQELQKAVVKGKLLGFTLEDVAKAGESLLNFESSIEKEMTANVLTGKRMNLDRARQLELMGDYVGAQDEMLKQMGDLESFSKMMPYQQKAMADALGMSVEEVTKILTKSKQLKDVGLTQAKIDEMMAGSMREVEKRINSISDAKQRDYLLSLVANKKQVAATEEFQTSVTRLVQTVQKVTYPLIIAVQGVLDVVANIIDYFTSILTTTTAIKSDIDGVTSEVTEMNMAGKIALGTFVAISGILTAMWATAKIGSLGKGIASMATNALNTIRGNATSAALPDSTGPAGGVTKSASKLKNASKIVTDSFNLVKSVAKGFTGVLNEIIVGMKSTLVNLIKLVTDSAKTLTDGLSKVLKSLVDGLASAGNSILKFLDGAVTKLFKMLTTVSNSLPTIIGNLGKAVGSFFSGMASGITIFAEAMAAPTPLFGLPVGLIFIAMAMGLATAARIAAPAIAALGPMFEGLASVVSAVGTSVSTIISAVADSIVKLSSINFANLIGVAGAISVLGLALSAFAVGSGMAGLSSMLTDLFAEDPVEKFNRFGTIDVDKINTVASAIQSLSTSIKDLTYSLQAMNAVDFQDSIEAINSSVSKVSVEKPKINAVSPDTNQIYSSGKKELLAADNNLSNSDRQMSEMLSLMKQLVSSVNQPVNISIGTKAIDEIERQTSLRRNYSTKYDYTYGTHS